MDALGHLQLNEAGLVVQIIHGLRSKGNLEFEEISEVVPFIEHAHDSGYVDLNKDQGYQPRIYKTHAWYPYCPKNAGKYIFITRYVWRTEFWTTPLDH